MLRSITVPETISMLDTRVLPVQVIILVNIFCMHCTGMPIYQTVINLRICSRTSPEAPSLEKRGFIVSRPAAHRIPDRISISSTECEVTLAALL